jgi:undecaprenyl-diphosphatase
MVQIEMIKKALVFFLWLRWMTCYVAPNYEQKCNHTTAIVLGIAQGITEFLPISSTGHMILVNRMLNGKFCNDNLTSRDRTMNSYFRIMQCGSIFAIVLVFYRGILSVFAAFCGSNAEGLQLARDLLVSLFPASLILRKLLYNSTSIACGLIFSPVLLFTFENNTPVRETL